jgi:hypothetical protein
LTNGPDTFATGPDTLLMSGPDTLKTGPCPEPKVDTGPDTISGPLRTKLWSPAEVAI